MSDKAAVDEEKALIPNTDVQTSSQQEAAQSADEFSKSKTKAQLSMRVKVYSPFRDYYDDQAFSISAESLTGPFDILPKHHNFISLLIPCELTIRSARDQNLEPIRIKISGGLMHVKADVVLVFLDV
jgi:hypothetical protein